MVTVMYDEIPLDDAPAVKAVLDAYDWPLLPMEARGLKEKEKRKSVAPPESPQPHPDPAIEAIRSTIPPWGDAPYNPPYWQRRLPYRDTACRWHENTDVWLTADEQASLLRRVVISGLKDEDEAKTVRYQVKLRQAASNKPLGISGIEAVTTHIAATRDERTNQRNFLILLTTVRQYFKWTDGEVVETEGTILAISKRGLKSDDIELLRQVFARLPDITESSKQYAINIGDIELVTEPVDIDDGDCPICGGGQAKARNKPVKNLKDAREKVEKFSAKVADEVFLAWVNTRTRVPDTPTYTKFKELYQDYVKWVKSYGHNKGERAESKRTAATPPKFGRMMGATFDRTHDARNRKYRVLLKRAPKAT